MNSLNMRIHILIFLSTLTVTHATDRSYLGRYGNQMHVYTLSKCDIDKTVVPLCGDELLIKASFATQNEINSMLDKYEIQNWTLMSMIYDDTQGPNAWQWSAKYVNRDRDEILIPFCGCGHVIRYKREANDVHDHVYDKDGMTSDPNIGEPSLYDHLTDTSSPFIGPPNMPNNVRAIVMSAYQELSRIVPPEIDRWKLTFIKCERYSDDEKWYWTVTFHQTNNSDNFITVPVSCEGVVMGEYEVEQL